MSRHRNTDDKDDQIAALLAQGATYARIQQELGTYSARITRVRTERGIALPPGRAKRTRAELDALERKAIRMLRNGATTNEIRTATAFTANRIAQLRKTHNLPVPYSRQRHHDHQLTIDEAFARHTIPAADGHLIWTGPRSGRHLNLNAEGKTHNPRRIAFRKHHGRDPIAYVIRTCCVIDCIAGAHHTDQTIRRTNLRTNP